MAFSLQSAIDELFKPPSRLQTMIDRAVGLDRSEPDLALNLDICELVNNKKGNFPHDAVFALLPYINGRSPSQAQLALTLLDNLVKNCGHAVHYQIATREFLNELFRRFPEYQPAMPNAVHYRVLEMLQEWRLTLCRRSRYKDDLQRINDMYALLRRKGWRFPELDAENAAVVLGPEDTLKSREELEKEDLEAMQAKLQELLRRATPRDLREANKLMKIITGYEQSSKQPDYDREWESELEAIENKARLLVEMLQKVRPGERIDDSAQELLAKCVSSQSRLQKLISDQERYDNDADDDSDAKRELARLIHLNDMIGDAVLAYKDLEKGRQPVFKSVDSSVQEPAAAGADNELIAWDEGGDEGGNDAANAQSALLTSSELQPPASKDPLDDLVGLDFGSMPAISDVSTPPLLPGQSTPGMTIMTPGLTAGVGSYSVSAAQRAQPMSNPSLPANSQQARLNKVASSKKDAFDFSDLMSAAKSIGRPPPPPASSSMPSSSQAAAATATATATAATRATPSSSASGRSNSPMTTNWGSAPDTSKARNNNDSLIDFLS
ncbi:ARF-binding protein [Dipsacomyces acuminosporus]|nr:ARF-binding protein [Dipsacomyces acuminosporus]